jgi:hypothetical protein
VKVVVLSIIIGALGFFLRMFPRIGVPFWGEDTWFHLLCIGEFKKRRTIQTVSQYFLPDDPCDYPPFLHILLSPFPLPLLEKYNFLISPFFDSLNIILVTLFTYFLTQSVILSCISGIILSLVPICVRECSSFSSRSFSSFLFNVAFISLLLYMRNGSPLFLLLTVITGGIVLLSHRFATQTLLILLISYSFILLDFRYLLIGLLIVLAAYALSKGSFHAILTGHIGIIRFWMRHYADYGKTYNPETYFGCFGEKFCEKIEGKRENKTNGSSSNGMEKAKKGLKLLSNHLVFNPFIIVPILYIFLANFDVMENMEKNIFLWSSLTIILFLTATWVKWLGHRPGNHQFLEYGSFPTALLGSLLIYTVNDWVLWGFIIGAIAGISVFLIIRDYGLLRTTMRESIFSMDDHFWEIIHFLKESDSHGVMVIPPHNFFSLAYFSRKRILFPVSAKNYEKMGDFYPVLRVKPMEIIKRYGLHCILLKRGFVNVGELELENYRTVFSNEKYDVIEID